MIESITTTSKTEDRSGKGILIGMAVALLITAITVVGYLVLQRRAAANLAAKQRALIKPTPTPRPSPEIKVFLDEAIVKGGQAQLSGTVQNISPNTVSGVSVSLQLFHRQGDQVDVRDIIPAPNDLQPNTNGSFKLMVSQKEFRTLKVLKVTSAANGREIAFVTAPGAERPREGPGSITEVENRSKTDGKGEIFINTPDNPQKVP